MTLPRRASLYLWLIALILAWSAGGKLFWPAEFQKLLHGLGLLPPWLITPTAYALPAAELLVAIAVVTGFGRTWALFLCLFLSLVFAGIHAYVILTGIPVSCGCAGLRFSTDTRPAHVVMLVLSIALALVAVAAIFRTAPRSDAPSASSAGSVAS